MAVDITALYCCLDDFCRVLADWEAHRLLPLQNRATYRQAVARRDAVHRGAVSPLALQELQGVLPTASAVSIAPALTSCRTMIGSSA